MDVGGYRSQAREALVKKAKEAAEKVRRWGEPVELEPMGSFDRRIIHHVFKDDPTWKPTASKWTARTKKFCCCARATERSIWPIKKRGQNCPRFFSKGLTGPRFSNCKSCDAALLGCGSVPKLL